MTTWVTTGATEGLVLYSPVGLRLLDELTSEAPIGNVEVTLDILDTNGVWQQTDIADVLTPSAVVTYPGLERHHDITGLPPRQYRVRLSADYYIPYYQGSTNGITFTADPHSDTQPPANVVVISTDTPLLPASNYPFAAYIPVLRGVVVDPANKPVPNVFVTQGNLERVLTDSRGTFALPLRWLAPNTSVPVDANDQRTGRTGQIQIQLPASLGTNQTISIH
jgi:hypothetical protein